MRFIPARAGNRPSTSIRYVVRPVHPRACGEQREVSRNGRVRERFIPARAGNRSPCAPSSPTKSGSSPRVRGTAHASSALVRWNTVHPRACGEQSRQASICSATDGSSPRVRGTGPTPLAERLRIRFIPARAGNSRCASAPVKVPSGSSPRVRGTASGDAFHFLFLRFIPARAGNSPPSSHVCRCGSVHPRACGEQSFLSCLCLGIHGSSPRVRGTGRARCGGLDFNRFIPARAGNRPRREGQAIPSSVHPRACGEQNSWPPAPTSCGGSSPRVRGTGEGDLILHRIARFIPARAGNSRRSSS